MEHTLEFAIRNNRPCKPYLTDGVVTLVRRREQIPDHLFEAARQRGDVKYIEVEGPTQRWAGGPYETPMILPPHHFLEAMQSTNASRAQYRWPGPPTFPCITNYPYYFDSRNQKCPSSDSTSHRHHHNQHVREPKDCSRCLQLLPPNHRTEGPICSGSQHTRPCNHYIGGPKHSSHCQHNLPPNIGGYQDCTSCHHNMPPNHHKARPSCQHNVPLNHLIGGLKDCSSFHHNMASNNYTRQPKDFSGCPPYGPPTYMSHSNCPEYEYCIPI